MMHNTLLTPGQDASSISINNQNLQPHHPCGYPIAASQMSAGFHLPSPHRVYQPWLTDCKAYTTRPNDSNFFRSSQGLFSGTNGLCERRSEQLPPTPPADGIKSSLISCPTYSPEQYQQPRIPYHQQPSSQVIPDVAMHCFNARLYHANCNILSSPIESHDKWWKPEKQHPYLPTSSSFAQTSIVQHMLSSSNNMAAPPTASHYGASFPNFNMTRTAAHHAALLAVGEHLPSTTITRRCARCRCPNCLSPFQVKNSSGKREHICHFPNCQKVYGKTSHLKAHIRWHLGERPFMCHWMFCGKSFTRSDELQRHLRTHTGEKKFKCSICEKRFMRSDHLSKHVKIHQKKETKKQDSQSTTESKA